MALLSLKNVGKYYPKKSPFLKRELDRANILNEIDLEIAENQTVGLIGESGCGKSTLAKLVMMLEHPSSGEILFRGKAQNSYNRKEYYRNIQMIFQDPYSSLNPRMKVKNIVGEMVRINGGSKSEALEKTISILNDTGLSEDALNKYPHEFSGGQRQRIAIARALVVRPSLLIADEPVSALDLALQSKIMKLLSDLKEKYGFSILFISHDLNSVARFCDSVSVMYLGRIVEKSSASDLIKNGKHPYLKALVESIPVKDPKLRDRNKISVMGEVPGPYNIPPGCSFHPRCGHKMDICEKVLPVLKKIDGEHSVACHLY